MIEPHMRIQIHISNFMGRFDYSWFCGNNYMKIYSLPFIMMSDDYVSVKQRFSSWLEQKETTRGTCTIKCYWNEVAMTSFLDMIFILKRRFHIVIRKFWAAHFKYEWDYVASEEAADLMIASILFFLAKDCFNSLNFNSYLSFIWITFLL